MSVQIRAITDEEFEAFRAHEVAKYAYEIAANYDVGPDDAREQADGHFRGLLRNGAATPDHHVRCIEVVSVDHDPQGPDAAPPVNAELVGYLWYSVDRVGGYAWLDAMSIFPAHRRKGYGRHALQALDAELRRMGIGGISLHVFGANTGAQEFYRRLGFRVTDVTMKRDTD
ncbi:GNAT family N-acetyltransferase [Candidatus Poribacteria bacterium]|jgi:ribosomal protein S18 acetylase RimI-like enzyme|nr:GNAT family N-acetyltransferase [Candidatus Poribacteria bacterium]MBT5531915.1 GNAT family N-acetyltransferase [Candidatus Poribacteria bacterium]MBT5710373.1 GNAT family N-acetyltransferase [Candidatus Poribacteria bacterium]MBT7099907.1 GNAT family N-acetyltransferase [Candidatus Poribacteria bacterium]MBT7807975.1 GNAT family N-acetyltransferase [Candidatus Poribacteria bacterium]